MVGASAEDKKRSNYSTGGHIVIPEVLRPLVHVVPRNTWPLESNDPTCTTQVQLPVKLGGLHIRSVCQLDLAVIAVHALQCV